MVIGDDGVGLMVVDDGICAFCAKSREGLSNGQMLPPDKLGGASGLLPGRGGAHAISSQFLQMARSVRQVFAWHWGLQSELLHLALPDAPCGGGPHRVRGSPPFAAANVSPDGEGQEGADMKLLHHSYSTNGVRPSGLS